MAVTSDNSELLHLRGTARNLETILYPGGTAPFVRAEVKMEEGTRRDAQPVVFARVLTPGIIRVKLKFAHYTVAGSYPGVLRVDGKEYPFVAEVVPKARLAFSPNNLFLTGAPNSQTTASITLVNSGNGTYEVQPVYAFGIFREGGVEDALGAAYRADKSDKRRWIDRVGDNLSDNHGGLVRVLTKTGAGPLNPGETRELELLFHIPDNVKPGKPYDGHLDFGDFPFQIRVAWPKLNDGEMSDDKLQ